MNDVVINIYMVGAGQEDALELGRRGGGGDGEVNVHWAWIFLSICN